MGQTFACGVLETEFHSTRHNVYSNILTQFGGGREKWIEA